MTRRVVSEQGSLVSGVYAYPPGGGVSVFYAILLSFKLVVSVAFGYHKAIYVVCSRSKLGFARDLIPLSMSLIGWRVIVHVHGSDFPRLFSLTFLGQVARLVYRNCEIIVPSAHLISELNEIRLKKVYLCENFTLPETTDSCAHAKRSDQDSLVVLWNSNVMASKGIRELVAGLSRLRNDGFLLRLIVLGVPVGDVEATELEMRQFLISLQKWDWIELIGQVRPEVVVEYIKRSDVVALPSTYASECQPLAIVQAMVSGRLVVVTATEAMRATIQSYPAFFTHRDEDSVVATFRRILLGDLRFLDSLDEEVDKARRRFSPDVFDARMYSILTAAAL